MAGASPGRHTPATPGDPPGVVRASARPGPVVVVGYGNPLRSDDGVGPAVAARLAGDPRLAGADIRAEHQLAPELAADIAGASLLVLVDAADGVPPGEITVRRLEPPPATGRPVEPGDGAGAWTHHVGPEALVALAHALFGAAPPVVLVGIGPASMEVGEALSGAVAPAVGRAADPVATIVEAHRHP